MQLLPLHLAFPNFGFVPNRSVTIWSVSWCQGQSKEKSVDWLVESCCSWILQRFTVDEVYSEAGEVVLVLVWECRSSFCCVSSGNLLHSVSDISCICLSMTFYPDFGCYWIWMIFYNWRECVRSILQKTFLWNASAFTLAINLYCNFRVDTRETTGCG